MDAINSFLARCRVLAPPRVLELGTLQSVPGRSTRHEEWVPGAREYVGVDLRPGADVDVVADVHRLADTLGSEQFDVVISCSTFEHLKYPQLAAHQLMKVLALGGLLFVQTHQTFPLHAYPSDYCRFSREALEALFPSGMGFRVIATDYVFPASIRSAREPGLRSQPAFLNVHLFGEKVAPTPEDFVYELSAPWA
jgi:hypothetical protein